MKKYILIDPLLTEAWTPQKEKELEQLKNDVKDGKVDINDMRDVKNKIAQLELEKETADEKPSEEPEPEQPSRRDAKDDEGSERRQARADIEDEKVKKIETPQEFVDRMVRDKGYELLGYEGEGLEQQGAAFPKKSGYVSGDGDVLDKPGMYDAYASDILYRMRKATGVEPDAPAIQLIVLYTFNQLEEMLFGLSMEDLEKFLTLVLEGEIEAALKVIEPKALKIVREGAEFLVDFDSSGGRFEGSEKMSDEAKSVLFASFYAAFLSWFFHKARQIATDKMYNNLVAKAKRLNMTKKQVLDAAIDLSGNATWRKFAGKTDGEIEALINNKMKDQGFDGDKWGKDTENDLKKAARAGGGFLESYFSKAALKRRYFFGPIPGIFETLIERAYNKNMNEVVIEKILGPGSKGMSVDEKIADIKEKRANYDNTLKQKEAKRTKLGKEGELVPAKLDKEIKDLETKIEQLDKLEVEIRGKVKKIAIESARKARLFAVNFFKEISSLLLHAYDTGVMINSLGSAIDGANLFEPSDFELEARPGKSLSRLDVSGKLIARATEAEAKRAKDLADSKGSFRKYIEDYREQKAKRSNLLKKILMVTKKALEEAQGDEKTPEGLGVFEKKIILKYEEVHELVEEMIVDSQSKTAENEQKITAVLDEIDKQKEEAAYNAREAALSLMKQDLDSLGISFTHTLVPEEDLETPLSPQDMQERKIKVSKSKLIDLISEQVKEQTQTINVTKDQLVALVTEEAFKQINRKK